MATRYIYIADDLNNKLKTETNASALISKLLMDYYKYNINNSEDAKSAILNLEEKRKQMIEQIEIEKERFIEIQIKQKEVELSEAELKKAKLKKRNELISNCIQNAKDIFNKELTIKQAEEYLDGDYEDLKTFLKIKETIIKDENK